jgi:hypothetical protein
MLFFWMIVVVFALLTYVVLDGYDLGIGVLTLFQPDAARRRQMLEVVGNVWDGNESWLILLAMGLWGGMPDAFATALPGLYIPLLVMIFALIFRGFAVEMTLHGPSPTAPGPACSGSALSPRRSPRASCSAACSAVSPSATNCSPARRGTSSGTATGCSPDC